MVQTKVCGAGSQFVCRAAYVRVFVLVKILETLDDGLRLLRRRSGVEPDQLAPMNRLIQNWKIAADWLLGAVE